MIINSLARILEIKIFVEKDRGTSYKVQNMDSKVQPVLIETALFVD